MWNLLLEPCYVFCYNVTTGNAVVNATLLHTNSTIGLVQFINQATGDIFGFGILMAVWLVILIGLSFRTHPLIGWIVASLIATGLSLLFVFAAIVSPNVVFLFGGLLICGVILAWATGARDPY